MATAEAIPAAAMTLFHEETGTSSFMLKVDVETRDETGLKAETC